MTGTPGSSCALVGSDSLLIECGEILLREGHTIACVMTDTPRLAQWALSREISVIDPDRADYPAELRQHEFDWLFSITWLRLLPEEVLALAKQYAINFHDGPLPAYAGLNAPAWAIMNGEREYGITWHVMTAGVDEGEILAQRRFEVAERETSLTINTRCFEEALDSFEEMIGKLSSGTIEPIAQDAKGRSYFGKFQRPEAGCEIDWTRSATELESFVRGLDFGRYPNPLGLPKIHAGGETCGVVEAVASSQTGTPGTVLTTDSDRILVAAGEGSLELRSFLWNCGRPATAPEVCQALGLQRGSVLARIEGDERTRLTELNQRLARSERFWLKRLVNLEAVELPGTLVSDEVAFDEGRIELEIPSSAESAHVVLAGFAGLLARLTGKSRFHLTFRNAALETLAKEHAGWIADEVPLEVALDFDASFAKLVDTTENELEEVERRQSWMRDLVARRPELEPLSLPVAVYDGCAPAKDANAPLQLHLAGETAHFVFDRNRHREADIHALTKRFTTFLESALSQDCALGNVELLSERERKQLLVEWNDTHVNFDRGDCVHHLFERQAAATPDAKAVTFGGTSLTYRELDQRASSLAAKLRELGVHSDEMIGVHVERSIDLVVAVLATLKSGAAYLPLDPAFPSDRIEFMLEDAKAPVILTQSALARNLQAGEANVLCVDALEDRSAPATDEHVGKPTDLAYVIYTSGSTGKPKGVMVEHRNVVNFFEGMDERVGTKSPGVWLAVTSLSFDISVLELLWTVCRGYEVVVYAGVQRAHSNRTSAIDFGLSFFASNAGEAASEQYRLLLDGARYADQNGFSSVWTPERHFHAFGGLYPNPAVTSAALATVTERIRLHSGSVVVPLHHPIRVAEEWSLVDNLSNGRVGISAASGWHPNDFVLAPDRYERRRDILLEDLDKVRRLWRGEAVSFDGPKGAVDTKLMPHPVQPELPIAITAAGNPETFRQAGESGYDLLTHLLGQSVEELALKIETYREAWRTAGHAGTGRVTIMLHTFIGENVDEVREIVRGPMREYLRSAVDLIKNHVSSWSAVKKTVDSGSAPEIGSLDELAPEDLEALLDYSFERYFETSALFGTPESCLAIVESLHAIGIDEITCLIDFGVPSAQVFESLPLLNELRINVNRVLAPSAPPADSVDELIERHEVTHLQCTPSMATMFVEDDATRAALGRLEVMMVGGEALPVDLARRLNDALSGKLLNMYGPTETTIWSSTSDVAAPVEEVTLGTPIANTALYVLDERRQLVPSGYLGELWIGGEGVTRGYHERPELTSERFAEDPFRPGERMYRTGDLVRWLDSGELEFAGRTDHQVKVRGYRIELGEIETALATHDEIAQAVVVTRETAGTDVRIVAYAIAKPGSAPTAAAFQQHLRNALPEYMIPSEFHVVDAFPLTPNGKIDRKALSEGAPQRSDAPRPQATSGKPVATPAPAIQSATGSVEQVDLNEILSVIRAIWIEVLGVQEVGLDENFFDLGGHSLLTIRVQKALKEQTGVAVPLVDMFRFATVRSLAESLAHEPQPASASNATSDTSGASRAAMRAAKRRRRAS